MTHLTQINTHQQKPGAGVTPWKPSASERPLGAVLVARPRITTWAFKVKKVDNLSKTWRVCKAPRNRGPATLLGMAFLL